MTNDEEYKKNLEIMRRIKRSLFLSMDYDLLLLENKERSLYDRLARGMSPWGAQTSRYPPEEADEE